MNTRPCLAKHGESIYGTRGGPWKPGRSVASTRRGNTVFLHLLDPGNGVVELPALTLRVMSATRWDGAAVRYAAAD